MAELDVINIKNPTSEDFIQRFNGEPYTIKAGEEKGFAQFVAFHIAHNLAKKMVEEAFIKEKGKQLKKEIENRQMTGIVNAEFAQLMVFDNPKRRIALYKILGDKDLVQKVVMSYPSGYKGFVGDMKEYSNFVEKESEVKIVSTNMV